MVAVYSAEERCRISSAKPWMQPSPSAISRTGSSREQMWHTRSIMFPMWVRFFSTSLRFAQWRTVVCRATAM